MIGITDVFRILNRVNDVLMFYPVLNLVFVDVGSIHTGKIIGQRAGGLTISAGAVPGCFVVCYLLRQKLKDSFGISGAGRLVVLRIEVKGLYVLIDRL